MNVLKLSSDRHVIFSKHILHLINNSNNGNASASIEGDIHSPIDFSKYLDINHIQVQEETPVARVYDLFKALGIRYCLVVRESRLIGIITKKDCLNFVREIEHSSSAKRFDASTSGDSHEEERKGLIQSPDHQEDFRVQVDDDDRHISDAGDRLMNAAFSNGSRKNGAPKHFQKAGSRFGELRNSDDEKDGDKQANSSTDNYFEDD